MSKPAGTLSYVGMNLGQLAEHFGPNDLIEVRRVQVEKKIVAKAMSSFSTTIVSPLKQETVEPEITVTDFDEQDGDN